MAFRYIHGACVNLLQAIQARISRPNQITVRPGSFHSGHPGVYKPGFAGEYPPIT
jgi:hypothetical protein